MTVIGATAFSGCEKLASIIIPEGVTRIECQLFMSCASLVSIYIPRSVEFIDSYVFNGCTSLVNISYVGSEEEWNTIEIIVDGNESFVNTNVIYLNVVVHTEGNWIIDTPAGCVTAGKKHTECAQCGITIRESNIPAVGHKYVSRVTREASCKAPGIITYSCACGDSYATYVYAEHNYVLDNYTEPVCDTDGVRVYLCHGCNDSYEEIVPGSHSYVPYISKAATEAEDGVITYTCGICGDSYNETIPARPEANVLLVQDTMPWNGNDNVTLLNRLLANGQISGWDISTTSDLDLHKIAQYNVIFIANDQTTATYNRLSEFTEAIENFVRAGGVVIYGACDMGWSGGNIDYTLPGGAEKIHFYSRRNYIADQNHAIVTAIYTDGVGLTNTLLYGNYCSHTAFDADTLPEGANIILQDAQGDPTLAEYALGDGFVILSGLTWEFYYSRNAYENVASTTYSKNVFDDLIVYAIQMSDPCDHAFGNEVTVPVNCTEKGYTSYECSECGLITKTNYIDELGHEAGEWAVAAEATEQNAGLREQRCTVCNELLASEVIPMLNATAVKIESEKNYLMPGEEISITINLYDPKPVTALAFELVFDKSVFELVSGEWLVDGAAMKAFLEQDLRAAAAWEEAYTPNGAVFTFTLRAKTMAAYTHIDCIAKMENGSDVVPMSVVPMTVTVGDCRHEKMTVTELDGDYHVVICEKCGYTEMVAHVYEDNGDTCVDCGRTRFISGDTDGNGDVNSADAIYLLYSVMFGEEFYPLTQHADFDGNGDINSSDAIYLLYNVMFGEEYYPLQ